MCRLIIAEKPRFLWSYVFLCFYARVDASCRKLWVNKHWGKYKTELFTNFPSFSFLCFMFSDFLFFFFLFPFLGLYGKYNIDGYARKKGKALTLSHSLTLTYSHSLPSKKAEHPNIYGYINIRFSFFFFSLYHKTYITT